MRVSTQGLHALKRVLVSRPLALSLFGHCAVLPEHNTGQHIADRAMLACMHEVMGSICYT
jgi:hypothetical protein